MEYHQLLANGYLVSLELFFIGNNNIEGCTGTYHLLLRRMRWWMPPSPSVETTAQCYCQGGPFWKVLMCARQSTTAMKELEV